MPGLAARRLVPPSRPASQAPGYPGGLGPGASFLGNASLPSKLPILNHNKAYGDRLRLVFSRRTKAQKNRNPAVYLRRPLTPCVFKANEGADKWKGRSLIMVNEDLESWPQGKVAARIARHQRSLMVNEKLEHCPQGQHTLSKGLHQGLPPPNHPLPFHSPSHPKANAMYSTHWLLLPIHFMGKKPGGSWFLERDQPFFERARLFFERGPLFIENPQLFLEISQDFLERTQHFLEMFRHFLARLRRFLAVFQEFLEQTRLFAEMGQLAPAVERFLGEMAQPQPQCRRFFTEIDR